MTKEEKEKAIDALKISTPVMAMTQEEFNDYIQTLNKVMDWLEQEPKTGHWISLNTGKPSRLKDGMTTESVKCSECDEWLTASNKYSYNGNYCPRCGCRMVDLQESEDKEGRMTKQMGELKINKSADYYNRVVKALEDAGFVIILSTETTTDRYYIVAKSEE